jgi:hypothetical protein
MAPLCMKAFETLKLLLISTPFMVLPEVAADYNVYHGYKWGVAWNRSRLIARSWRRYSSSTLMGS